MGLKSFATGCGGFDGSWLVDVPIELDDSGVFLSEREWRRKIDQEVARPLAAWEMRGGALAGGGGRGLGRSWEGGGEGEGEVEGDLEEC